MKIIHLFIAGFLCFLSQVSLAQENLQESPADDAGFSQSTTESVGKDERSEEYAKVVIERNINIVRQSFSENEKKDNVTSMFEWSDMMRVLNMCMDKYAQSKDSNSAIACSIHALYPLAQQENFLAAFLIGLLHEELDYPKEAQKWYEYTLAMEFLDPRLKPILNERLKNLGD